MAESLFIDSSLSKTEKYQSLLPQIKALTESESDIIANLANICSALKYGMDFFWIGFYLVKENQLVLGPFQGTVACTRIDFDKGVCGACYREQKTLIVPDVEAFPGHIACSSLSRSEIVVPIFNHGSVAMVLDVDSTLLDDYDEIDKKYLEEIARWIEEKLI
ncbi:MAG: GAF domain-containing protein [Thermoflexibacter sp.]|jgi:GAF domain-containing protein|nr:GAF domain-containing protein [Thermoflexibacter sp.]